MGTNSRSEDTQAVRYPLNGNAKEWRRNSGTSRDVPNDAEL